MSPTRFHLSLYSRTHARAHTDVEPNWSPSIWLGVLLVFGIIMLERIYTTCRRMVASRGDGADGSGARPTGNQNGFEPIVHSDDPEMGASFGMSGGDATTAAAASQYSITDEDDDSLADDTPSPSSSANTASKGGVRGAVAMTQFGASSKTIRISGGSAPARASK